MKQWLTTFSAVLAAGIVVLVLARAIGTREAAPPEPAEPIAAVVVPDPPPEEPVPKPPAAPLPPIIRVMAQEEVTFMRGRGRLAVEVREHFPLREPAQKQKRLYLKFEDADERRKAAVQVTPADVSQLLQAIDEMLAVQEKPTSLQSFYAHFTSESGITFTWDADGFSLSGEDTPFVFLNQSQVIDVRRMLVFVQETIIQAPAK